MVNIGTIIAELSLKQFNSLPKTGRPTANEWTVLSCIVRQQGAVFEVVSLGTGSKCIGKSKMCPKGTIINDSHAEIICRRAFLRYLYSQLDQTSSIFIFDQQKKIFSLKPDVKFHFFTTHVPCGDAAIFPKQESEDYGDIIDFAKCKDEKSSDEIPAKKMKMGDVFRTGAKCLGEDDMQDPKGEGCAYHHLRVVRTKPGRGDPTSSVSCSDKLTKWCYLGIQGALLMLFLEKPIYLSSFTILKETPFCPEALQRALSRRIKNITLTQPYYQNILDIFEVDLHFLYKKEDYKVPCSSSIAWFLNCEDSRCLEVAVNGRKQGVTKKNFQSEKARLKICKLELFKMFIHKFKEHKIKLNLEIEEITYKEAKSLSKVYQDNWQILKGAFNTWTRKDGSLLQFVACED